MFLGLAFFLFAKGAICIFNYPTHATDGELDRPDLTPPDQERQIRILQLKMKLMISTGPLAVVIVFYTLLCAFRLLGVWSDAIIKYAPADRTDLYRQIQI